MGSIGIISVFYGNNRKKYCLGFRILDFTICVQDFSLLRTLALARPLIKEKSGLASETSPGHRQLGPEGLISRGQTDISTQGVYYE